MRTTKLAVVLITAAAVSSAGRNAGAEEGMFTLESSTSIPTAAMRKVGFKMDTADLLRARQAIALVASGGSGSFVSSRGLLVTNHHVAFRCLAALDGTDAHKGVMDGGHVAKAAAEELPCPNYDLMVVEDVRDVTAEIKAAAKTEVKGHARFEALRRAIQDAETACGAGGAYCDVEPLDGGRAYQMMVYELIRDVRLVYAPEHDLGNFGGDVDNWRYPRHSADFTFLRAYVSPTGDGAAYSPDNVPFEPKAILEISKDGVARGDEVNVIGFPARTKRHFPGAAAKFAAEVEMPSRRAMYGGLLEVVQRLSAADETVKRRYQGLDASLNNAAKYMADVTASFEKWGVVAKFEARDANADPKLVARIDAIFGEWSRAYPRFSALQRIPWAVRSVGTVFDIAMWTVMRGMDDRDRNEDAYQNKNMYKTVGRSDLLDEQVVVPAEKELLVYFVHASSQLPKAQRVRAFDWLVDWGKKEAKRVAREARAAGRSYHDLFAEIAGTAPGADEVTTAVDLLFGRTRLLARSTAPEETDRALFLRRRLFYNDAKDAARFRDPLLEFGRQLAAEYLALRNGPYRAVEETFDSELRPLYAAAVGATYPDANFQLRLSFGTVQDYTSTADGAKHRYVTDLSGLLAKNKGAFPFRAPDALLAAAAADKGRFVDAVVHDVPVNFTSTLDTTGGNSGSAVIDSRGRLVGLLFDGTPESQLSDWQFLADEQRSIVLDIRFALFLADKVHGAKALLEELGL